MSNAADSPPSQQAQATDAQDVRRRPAPLPPADGDLVGDPTGDLTGDLTRTRCQGLKKDGQPCRARPVGQGTFCLFHDPEHSTIRAEGQARGGALAQARRKLAKAKVEALVAIGSQPGTPAASIESVGSLVAYLARVIERVDSRTLSPAAGAVVINGLRLAKDLLSLSVEISLIEQARNPHSPPHPRRK